MADGLRYGRGMRKGPDAYVGQQESFATRAAAEPQHTGWVFDAMRVGSYLVEQTPAVVSTLVLTRCPLSNYVTAVSAARLNIGGLAAGEWVDSAIFVFDRARRFFSMVGGTKARFPMDAVAALEVSLPEAVTLVAGVQYFLGTLCSSGAGAGTVTCMGSNNNTLEYGLEYPITYMPATVALTQVAKVSSRTFLPYVEYFSPMAAEVI